MNLQFKLTFLKVLSCNMLWFPIEFKCICGNFEGFTLLLKAISLTEMIFNWNNNKNFTDSKGQSITPHILDVKRQPNPSSSPHSRSWPTLDCSPWLLCLATTLFFRHIHCLGYGIHDNQSKRDQVHPLIWPQSNGVQNYCDERMIKGGKYL